MQKVLTAEQMRTVDRLTTERYGIPPILLMENAAHAVARVITEKLGGSVKGKSVLILCGKGNNGGDGAALARILWTAGASCDVFLFGKLDETKGDARVNFEIAQKTDFIAENYRGSKLGLRYFTFTEVLDLADFHNKTRHLSEDVCVDALFGTGLSRRVEGDLKMVIGHLNHWIPHGRRSLIVSLDVPSGINADSARRFSNFVGEREIEDDASSSVQPDLTVTFTAPKLASVMPPASNVGGELRVVDIGTPEALIDECASQTFVSVKEDATIWLGSTRFNNNSFKNKRGHALVIAGSKDYSGAAVLAGNAAMRSGVGLVTLAVPTAIRSEVAARALPDLIVRPFDEGREIDFAADAILIGCGLDANNNANEAMFRKIVEERTTPVIVDAGALWFFRGLTTDRVQPPATAGGSDLVQMPARVSSPHVSKGSPPENSSEQPPLILTPHEGEFMRLVGETKNHPVGSKQPPPLLGKEGSLKEDRVAAVREFATSKNVILVLKGERVLIGAPDGRVVVNPTGNSGLGKAGNGDTLAGILAGFVAQAVKFEIDIFETVVAAVYVAGMAGDIAEKKYGKRVMTASDVRECLADVFAELNAK